MVTITCVIKPVLCLVYQAVVFLCCCADCLSYPDGAIQMDQANYAI